MVASTKVAHCFSTCCPCWQRAEKLEKPQKPDGDPRINVFGRAIEDDFATIRENYSMPARTIQLEV
jgi:triacylglycerol lipase